MSFSDLAAAAALGAVIGPDGGNLTARLYKSNSVVDDLTDPATLLEADFDGYAPLTVAWTPPTGTGDGSARSYSDPHTWTKGSNHARDQVIYATALFLSGEGQPANPVKVANLPSPVPLNRAGALIELQFVIAGTITPQQATRLGLVVDFDLVFRGRRLSPALRARLLALRKELRMVWGNDARADGAFERSGKRSGVFFNDTVIAEAAYQVRRRLDALLGRTVSVQRVDTPLQQEITGVLQPKL